MWEYAYSNKEFIDIMYSIVKVGSSEHRCMKYNEFISVLESIIEEPTCLQLVDQEILQKLEFLITTELMERNEVAPVISELGAKHISSLSPKFEGNFAVIQIPLRYIVDYFETEEEAKAFKEYLDDGAVESKYEVARL